MAKIKATEAQMETLYNNRELKRTNKYQWSTKKKAVFAEIKRDHGLPSTAKIGIRSLLAKDDPARYGVIYNKRTQKDYDNGLPEPTVAAPVVAAVEPAVVDSQGVAQADPALASAKAEVVKAVTKVAEAKVKAATAAFTEATAAVNAPVKARVGPATKVAAKPAPKVAAKPAPKVAAKPATKVAAKPATKVAAKPTPKVAAKPAAKPKDLLSPVKTDKCQIEVRTTINGVRKRLGYASSEAAKAKAIAAAKA